MLEVRGNVTLKLLKQEGGSLLTATPVPDGVLDLDLIQDSAVIKLDKDRIADGPLRRLVVLDTESLVLNASDLSAEGVNAGITSGRIGV